MAKKFNLAELLPADERVSNSDHAMEIREIPIQKIDANWKNFYSVDMNEVDLAESIEVSGLLTPLGVLAKPDGHYKLISGHRRWRALRYLHDRDQAGRERWAEIPCVVYDDPADADREELMLIHANAQRVKSGPELAKEAQKTTEILTRMKEAGAELPGRMRDRVAEALQISSTRLARIEAIEKNLTYPGWRRKWDQEKLGESVAYRLSQLDYSQQMHTADWMIDHHVKDEDVSLKLVEEALRHPPIDNPGCHDPLFYEEDPVKVDRELVRRMGTLGYFSGTRFANRKDGMDQLKLAFRNMGHGSDELEWDGDPKGIRFRKPVEWLLGWGAMYDALAANALDDAIAAATTRPAPAAKAQQAAADPQQTAADPMTAPAVSTGDGRWRSCKNDPPAAWTLAFVFTPYNAQRKTFDVDLMQFHDGLWWGVYDACDDEMDTDASWWLPAGPVPAEVWD